MTHPASVRGCTCYIWAASALIGSMKKSPEAMGMGSVNKLALRSGKGILLTFICDRNLTGAVLHVVT